MRKQNIRIREEASRLSLRVFRFLALSMGIFAAAQQFGFCAPAPVATPLQDAVPNYRTDEIPVIKSTVPLFSLLPEGGAEQVRLTGIYPERSFRFYSPKNEIISKAQVVLKYTPSPSLTPMQSQVNVYLNGQLQTSLPITQEQLGKQISQTVEIDPKTIEETNRLTLEFVGVYAAVCSNVANPSLWLSIDNSSYVTFNVQKLRIANELSIFPTPFVNTLSPAATELPVFFDKNPSNSLKQAAGIFASWVGTKTEWRGADFPVYISEVPADQDFVAFVTNDSRPDFLQKLPRFEGPAIAVVDAPNSLSSKILVIAGQNDEDLVTASRWLATSSQPMAGSSVQIQGFGPLPERKPYDAPNWVSTNGKVAFDQLIKYRGQLRSTGIHPAPISVEIKLPPDLFMVNRSNVGLDLKYRYTKPTGTEVGQMRFTINDQLVDSFTLDTAKTSNSFVSQFSLLDGLAGIWNGTSIPSRLLSPTNLLKFDFEYGLGVEGGSQENCKSVVLIPNQVEIDPNSTIDFSGFYHFAKLPDLKLFTVSGFPFSKYADLSETSVLIAGDASASILTTYLNTMARIGSQTGYPATKVVVSDKSDSNLLKAKDILVFTNTTHDLGNIQKTDAELALGKLKDEVKGDFEGQGKITASSSRIEENEGIAAIIQYQSPYDSDRSVVALIGDGQDGSHLLSRKLMNPGDLKLIGGSIAIFKPNASPASYEVGDTYYTGSLPWHQRVWYSMLDQPLLLVLFTLVCATLFAVAIYYLMHSLIRYRGRRHK